VRLARLAGAAGFPLVYTSSCSVYGVASDGAKTEESTPNPQTMYARCKVLVERALAAMAPRTSRQPSFGMRPPTARRRGMRFDIVLNNLASLPGPSGQVTMLSDGTPWRPLVHVGDICEAIARTLAAPARRCTTRSSTWGMTRRITKSGDRRRSWLGFSRLRATLWRAVLDNRSYRVSFGRSTARCRASAAARRRCRARPSCGAVRADRDDTGDL